MFQIYDTTLRDGMQGIGTNFTLHDKLLVVKKLDELGIAYIEGGWPHRSNVKEVEFFKQVKLLDIKAKIVAFGSTKRPGTNVLEDQLIEDLIVADTSVIAIFGKSWNLHVTEVIHTTLEENLKMIKVTVEYLKLKGKEVIYDAEHFFDGYKANSDYALQTILAAQAGGADTIVFCDTNGGCLPDEIEKIILEIKPKLQIPFGIHCHNDAGVAIANSLEASQLGVSQIQGTINGYGERCGNTDLCILIPNLQLKMGIKCISDNQLVKLKEISSIISELANRKSFAQHPYVGSCAFTHKGGMHIDAVLKNKKTFEHIEPELVGNSSDLLVSEQAGKSVILNKLKKLNFHFDKKDPEVSNILGMVKYKEAFGYTYESAEASFELLVLNTLGQSSNHFVVDHYEITTNQSLNENAKSVAKVCVEINQNLESSQAEGKGPVNALDLALRKVLLKFYPQLEELELVDYKVRVLSSREGTGAKVRVLIEFRDEDNQWTTVGVSENVIEASWEALLEGFYYKLLRK